MNIDWNIIAEFLSMNWFLFLIIFTFGLAAIIIHYFFKKILEY